MINHLFDGEKIIKSSNSHVQLSDEQINKKYIEGDIRIVTEQGRYPLETVYKMFSDKKKYNDRIDYQREYIWSDLKRSLLIESFILNVPIPPIFLYEIEYSYYEIMDGKQRISAIVDYYDDRYALEGLEIWSELNGKKYSELPQKIKEGLDRRYLSSIIMLKESEKDKFEVNRLKKIVFERLNTGGQTLTPQESRNAIFSGKFNDLCKRLAQNQRFREIWGIEKKIQQFSIFDENDPNNLVKKSKLELHMQDVELVLRYFAYRQIDSFDGNLNTFLDFYLDNANKYDDILLGSLEKNFIEVIDFAYDLFDETPFRMWDFKNGRPSKKRSAVRTIYDPMMQVLNAYLPYKHDIISKKDEIQAAYINLFKEHPDEFSGKIQHRATILAREEMFTKMIDDVLQNN